MLSEETKVATDPEVAEPDMKAKTAARKAAYAGKKAEAAAAAAAGDEGAELLEGFPKKKA